VGWGAGRSGEVVEMGLEGDEIVVWGLNVTVLGGLGGFWKFEADETGVGWGRRGDLSVEAEAIVGWDHG